jgi:RHS repeat-associated protein
MEKKSGVQSNSRSVPTMGGGSHSTGDTFQPNLAMGGGSYKIPFDLPNGAGGFSPKLDLIYNTGYSNGVFGMGWQLGLPFVSRARPSVFTQDKTSEFTLGGAERLLVSQESPNQYIPAIQQKKQVFLFDNNIWTSRTTDLAEMRFGGTPNSQVVGIVDGKEIIERWLLDKLSFSGNRTVNFNYRIEGAQRYLDSIHWSVFSLKFIYEDRPDRFSLFDTGFEIPTSLRCQKIELHHDKLAPNTLIRTYDFGYEQTDFVKTTLLKSFQVTGWKVDDTGILKGTALPPFTFGYTAFDLSDKKIQKFSSKVTPPPAMGDDTTVLDYRGTGLPGIMRMNGIEATYWENQGNLSWGPPEKLNKLPQGIRLSEEAIRFADITGNGTADLVLSDSGGGAYYANDPEQGFLPKTNLKLAPSFNLNDDNTWLIDVDGDRVADLLCFRNGQPMVFLNKQGLKWEGPFVLPDKAISGLNARYPTIQFADMTGSGTSDLVVMTNRQISYYPFLGNGRWGEKKVMAHTPAFKMGDATEGVYLADIDANGLADLIITKAQEVHIYLNSGGHFFSEPIILKRTPLFRPDRFILADMTGSGTSGLLWTAETSLSNPHGYWYLDLLNGVKPYLLNVIDNGRGLSTEISYSTSAFERTRAKTTKEGKNWTGYLPFVVHVVKSMTFKDSLSKQIKKTTYNYQDGHFDGFAREYMGFAQVDAYQMATAHEAAQHQRYYFHNRNQSAQDLTFIAGKGQPTKVEIIDPSTSKIQQIEENDWEAIPIKTTNPLRPAYLTLERERRSRRIQDDLIYAEESMHFIHDEIGNLIKEDRKGRWLDAAGNNQFDHLTTEYAYAKHPLLGTTSIQSLIKKKDGITGKLLKHIIFYFDGEPFVGLPEGVVEQGFRSRQTEIALTQDHIDKAYNGSDALIRDSHRIEMHPEFGKVYVHDTRRYRNDAFGNVLETLDALGFRVQWTFDTEGLHPVTFQEADDRVTRKIIFDPIVQQLSSIEDKNGHFQKTKYNAVGDITAVYRPGFLVHKPTEEYDYDYSSLPISIVQRARIHAEDETAGWIKIKYLDGSGNILQEKVKTEKGSWAVGKQEIISLQGKRIEILDAYFSETFDFVPIAQEGLKKRTMQYDFSGRIVSETTFLNHALQYIYHKNETRFYNAEDNAAFLLDATVLPTRISRDNAWGKIVSIIEREKSKIYEVKRQYDALSQLTHMIDPLENVALENFYDLWGNIIRINSAEAGITKYIFDGNNNKIQSINADGRKVSLKRDIQGRVIGIHEGDDTQPASEILTYDTGTGTNLKANLAQVQGQGWSVSYSYNENKQPTRIQWHYDDLPSDFTFQFTYNTQKDITSIEYPDGTHIDYNYFDSGLLKSIPGYITALEYNATGKRSMAQFANGLETSFIYTEGDYLLKQLKTQTSDATSRLQHLKYTLDAGGQVLKIEDLANLAGKIRNNQTFEYDRRNRLTRATGKGFDGDYDFTYKYDALGNLIFSSESFDESLVYGQLGGDASHPNRLIKKQSAATPQYLYDASGNMTRDPDVGQMEYDNRHRLIRLTKTDGTVLEYTYDHNNNRIRSAIHSTDGSKKSRYEMESRFYIDNEAKTTKFVIDDERKLAIIPHNGDTFLHHFDRLGNVNIVSNLSTGAYIGQNEYTPFGQLSVSMLIQPNFTFQGIEFNERTDIALMGARHYRPRLGRFLSPDTYLATHQDKMPGLLVALNLYVYAYDNPTNITDPTGQIAFLVVLLIAVIIGAIVGAIGAAVNGASSAGEWAAWILGGMIGGALVAVTGGGIVGWGAMIFGSASFTGAALAGVIVWGAVALVGTLITPLLDNSDSPVAWFFSFLIKWFQSPVLTTLGLIVALFAAIGGQKVDFRRGMLFVEQGINPGSTITLGAIAWGGSDMWDTNGHFMDNIAKHEAYHSRTIVAMGELGFYVTYVITGIITAITDGDFGGHCNPFEKSAYEDNNPMDISTCRPT